MRDDILARPVEHLAHRLLVALGIGPEGGKDVVGPPPQQQVE